MILLGIIAKLQELVDRLAVDLARYGSLGLVTDRKDFLQELPGVCSDALDLLQDAAKLGAFPLPLAERLREKEHPFDFAVKSLRCYCVPGGYRAPYFDIPEAPDEYKVGVTGFESMHYIHTVLVAFISLAEHPPVELTQPPNAPRLQ